MAFIDELTQRIVVRIVYDGPAMAGKTTNVRKLFDAFRGRRGLELVTPDQAGERTRFMDWMQVDTGLISGRKLTCHFISVPGQRILAQRRKLLLGLADSIVFVCSAEKNALTENQETYASLREHLTEQRRDVPIVIQVNKQDHPEAMSLDAIRKYLDLDRNSRLIEAQARDGAGVRETAIHAIRAAADRVQNQVLRFGFESLVDPAWDAPQLAEIMREQEQQDLAPTTHQAPPSTEPFTPLVFRAEITRAKEQLPPELLDSAEGAADSAPPTRSAESMQLPPSTVRINDSILPESSAPPRLPPLPHPGAPSGFIWPANDGRDLLRRALQVEPELDPASTSSRLRFDAGRWTFWVDTSVSYANADRAKEALLRAARNSLHLDQLRFPQLVLCLSRGENGRFYLWRISQGAASIHDGLLYGLRTGKPEYLEDLLLAYLRGLESIHRLSQETSLQFAISPEAFCLLGDRVYYMFEDQLQDHHDLSEALLAPFTDREYSGDLVLRYADAVAQTFRDGSAREALEQLITLAHNARPRENTESPPDLQETL